MNTKRFNIIIKPDLKTEHCCNLISSKLSNKFHTFFTLDSKNFFSHITLYSPELPISNYEKISSTISSIANAYDVFEIEFDELMAMKGGNVFANYKYSESLGLLRQNVVSNLNPLREGVIRDKYKDLKYLSLKEKEEVEQYGYPINRYHFPHITLSVLQNPSEATNAVQVIGRQTFPASLTVKSLAICETGTLGTVTKILQVYNLNH